MQRMGKFRCERHFPPVGWLRATIILAFEMRRTLSHFKDHDGHENDCMDPNQHHHGQPQVR
jgi:hypothetical protein